MDPTLTLVLALAAAAPAEPSGPRAQALLRQAREALGGARLEAVHSFRLKASRRRLAAGGELESEVDILVALPGRLRKREHTRLGDVDLGTHVQVLNGAQGGREGVLDLEHQALARELDRLALLFLIRGPGGDPTYIGDAVAPDGTADVLEFASSNQHALRLFVDSTTHRPLMLTYRGPSPRATVLVTKGASREEVQQKSRAAMRRRAEAPGKGPVEIEIRVDNYRPADGILWPGRLSVSTDGEIIEEWTIQLLEAAPKIRPGEFSPGP